MTLISCVFIFDFAHAFLRHMYDSSVYDYTSS